MIPIHELQSRVATGEPIRSLIRRNLETTKVTIGQLDPNGLCNASCWFCPVRYEGNPKEFISQMSPENFDLILKRIRSASVVGQFPFIYTANYNEVLLWKHFATLPNILRQNGFRSMVLSNGSPLTPDKTDIIMANADVFNDICLNVPALEKSDWSQKSGLDEKIHSILLRNLDYLNANTKIPVLVSVNCITDHWAGDLKSKGFFTHSGRAQRITNEFRARFPNFRVEISDALVDRAGNLDKAGVIKNQRSIMMPNQQVIGCNHDLVQSGSRIYGWLHINARGDLFICCDDYKMEYRFGNLLEKSLDELWLSENHVTAIEEAFKNLCRGCCHHITT